MTADFVPVGWCWPAEERCDDAFTEMEVCIRFGKLEPVLVDVFMVFPRVTVEAFILHLLWNIEIVFVASGLGSRTHTHTQTHTLQKVLHLGAGCFQACRLFSGPLCTESSPR